MKILYVTTVLGTMRFFPEHIKMLQEEGHEVEIASNCNGNINEKAKSIMCKIHHIPFSRNVYSPDNLSAYFKIKKLIKEGNYSCVHVHTPNAAAIVRFACRDLRKKGLKVIYTAHGFHFYQGAPLKNWVLFYPVEWICAHWTDILITINQEDFRRARRHMKAKCVEYVPGVGIELESFSAVDINRKKMREELGVGTDEAMLLSVGELNKNKNHETVIRAIAGMKDEKLHYFIAGRGNLNEYLKKKAEELGCQKQVHFLGYREDIRTFYECADIFLFPSYREGLPVSLMEAMASGLPVVCSRIRGNMDLIVESKGGFLCNPKEEKEFAEAIWRLQRDKDLCGKMRKFNQERIKKFGLSYVLEEMKRIYGQI